MKNSSRRFFTLIEIVTAMIVISLALMIVAPRAGRFSRDLVVESTLTKFRFAFRNAARLARETGTKTELRLSVDASGAVTIGLPESSGMADTHNWEEMRGVLEDKELTSATKWLSEEQAMYFRFYPNGEASGDGPLELEIRGTRFSLDVDPLNGRPLLGSVEQEY